MFSRKAHIIALQCNNIKVLVRFMESFCLKVTQRQNIYTYSTDIICQYCTYIYIVFDETWYHLGCISQGPEQSVGQRLTFSNVK